ncbi:hypothetical protein D3H35_03095 [Cohnella faecalis]|uniref:Uncharacterized protein n=1 Tax=Cohnella faecalis TaxID=2315694 RepID=A0A398D1Z1_9BACL|nr:hypothetical protein D3H35_03080 [Cohnella faecalis]RIE05125.1 hypothetical protein D3H35_03095 [Cohnella faecalis]
MLHTTISYGLDDTELAEYEAENKGYRKDVFVKIQDDYYNLRTENIKEIICLLYDDGYFKHLKPVDKGVHGFA